MELLAGRVRPLAEKNHLTEKGRIEELLLKKIIQRFHQISF
jgi:hypothetical protein